MEIEAVLFDLGSTLLFFDGDWLDVLPQADRALLAGLQQAGMPVDENFSHAFRQAMLAYFRERELEFVEYTTLSILRNTLVEFGISNTSEAVLRQVLAAFHTVTQSHWQLEVDALPTLGILRDRGYRLGLVSNAGDDADVQKLIDKSGVRDFFQVILTSAAEGIRKPNPVIFQRALQQLKVNPERAVMVGDMLGADILGARNAGIFGIWITRRADNPQNLAHANTILPDAQIMTLAELPALLLNLSKGT